MTYPLSRPPLHWASAVVLIAFDWGTFALNLRLLLTGQWPWVAAGAGLLAGIAVGGVEHQLGRSGTMLAAAKAVVAGMVVAIPFPYAGSAVGAIALLWIAADHIKRDRAAQSK